ncbi:MAG: phosphatase PAP2 family protein [Burkholderiales bacterium]|nr:phosphatase PAP2 family protein [Burkholderiales bacterium]
MVKKISVLIILLIAIILSSQYIDQKFALIPYDDITRKFYGEIHLWCKIIYYGVNVATFAIIASLVIAIVLYFKSNLNKTLLKRFIQITSLSMLIGPGLIVNKTFKEHWGRARPYQVIRDGGDFSLPWQPNFKQPSNNSFPSGHASIGAFIGVPFIAARRRKLGFILCGLGAFLVGMVRWLQGGHYFSDICIAILIVWLVTTLVSYFVDKKLEQK